MSETAALTSLDIQTLQRHVELAIELAESGGDRGELLESLREAREMLSAIAASRPATGATRHDGSIQYTLEDESCEPYGRELDVRVYFDWDDYSSQDAPSTAWGARVSEIEVLAVRYFDQQGNSITVDEHHLEAAWELLERDRELVEQLCAEAADSQYITFDARRSAPAAVALRMAPSQRDRRATSARRKHG